MKKVCINSGDIFGKLTIQSELPTDNKRRVFKCICSCGNACEKTINALRKKGISSCGCYQKEFNNAVRLEKRSEDFEFKQTRLYKIWIDMKRRCTDKNRRAYKWYGAKGICVVDEWQRFLNFREWALSNGYDDVLTIDRLDSDKNYEPSNCRWIPFEDQNRNKKNNRKVIFEGKEMCVSEVSVKTGKCYTTIISRLNKGQSLAQALS